MAERKTTVVIEAQPKGFDKAKRAAKGAYQELDPRALNKGTKALNKELSALSKQFRGMRDSMKDLDKLLSMKDGVKGAAEMRKEIERLNREVDRMSRRGGAGAGASGGIRGGFGVGVLQGAGLGEVFVNNGFGRNVAGRMAGRGMRRGASVATSGFSGLGGLAQAAGGIPIAGGFLSGQVSNLMATSQMGMAALRERQRLVPYMGAAALGDEMNAARSRAVGANPIAKRDALAVTQAGYAAMQKAEAARSAPPPIRALDVMDIKSGRLNRAALSEARSANVDPATLTIEAMEAEEKRQTLAVRRSRSRQNRAVAKAERGVLGTPMKTITGLGAGMGLGPAEARQLTGDLTQAAGGSLLQFTKGKAGREFLGEAMASQQLLGVGANVSGAFMREANLGNMEGGAKGALHEFRETIRSGMGLALEGSDLQHYMQTTAQAMARFEQTGMALEPASIGQMGRVMAMGGLGGVRGASVGAQVAQAGQRLALSGPSSGVEQIMFRELYGFKGGGIDDFARAQRDAAGGKIQEGGLQRFVKKIIGGKSAGEGQVRLLEAFKSIGVALGPQEAYALAGGNSQKTKEIQERLTKAQKRAEEPLALQQGARDVVPEALKRDARIKTMKEGTGMRVVPIAQSLEESQAKVLQQFGRLAPELNKVSRELGAFATSGAQQAVDLFERVEKLVDFIATKEGAR